MPMFSLSTKNRKYSLSCVTALETNERYDPYYVGSGLSTSDFCGPYCTVKTRS